MSGVQPTAELFQKNAKIHGITVGRRASQRDRVAAIEVNGIEPLIGHSFQLADKADALRLQESQQHFGTICFTL